MVRLGARHDSKIHQSVMFQFQYGSIGRKNGDLVYHVQTSVSIPVWFDWESYDKFKLLLTQQFQFQYGSIGSSHNYEPLITKAAFQFQYGSIGSIMSFLFFAITAVSIPVWFDWERRTVIRSIANCQFQFQYGSIGSLVH